MTQAASVRIKIPLTVTTWLLPGGPTSTCTDVRETVSRFIRDKRTPSVPVWAKIAAATARWTGSAHRAVRTCPGRPCRPTIGVHQQSPVHRTGPALYHACHRHRCRIAPGDSTRCPRPAGDDLQVHPVLAVFAG